MNVCKGADEQQKKGKNHYVYLTTFNSCLKSFTCLTFFRIYQYSCQLFKISAND